MSDERSFADLTRQRAEVTELLSSAAYMTHNLAAGLQGMPAFDLPDSDERRLVGHLLGLAMPIGDAADRPAEPRLGLIEQALQLLSETAPFLTHRLNGVHVPDPNGRQMPQSIGEALRAIGEKVTQARSLLLSHVDPDAAASPPVGQADETMSDEEVRAVLVRAADDLLRGIRDTVDGWDAGFSTFDYRDSLREAALAIRQLTAIPVAKWLEHLLPAYQLVNDLFLTASALPDGGRIGPAQEYNLRGAQEELGALRSIFETFASDIAHLAGQEHYYRVNYASLPVSIATASSGQDDVATDQQRTVAIDAAIVVLRDELPEPKLAPANFVVEQEVLRIARFPASDPPSNPATAAIFGAGMRELAEEILEQVEGNVDRRVAKLITRIRDTLQPQLNIIELAALNLRVLPMVEEFRDELPKIAIANMRALADGIEAYAAQFREWREFLQEAASARLGPSEIGVLRDGTRELVTSMRASDLVDPEVPDVIEALGSLVHDPATARPEHIFSLTRTLENVMSAVGRHVLPVLKEYGTETKKKLIEHAATATSAALLMVLAGFLEATTGIFSLIPGAAWLVNVGGALLTALGLMA